MKTIRTMSWPAQRPRRGERGHAADPLLSGAITSRSGKKLEGVTVIRQAGELDHCHSGLYGLAALFLPGLFRGKYACGRRRSASKQQGRCGAYCGAASGFHAAGDVRSERRFRQLPGEMMVAHCRRRAPRTPRTKGRSSMNNCTGCHSTRYALQFRFDEAGWEQDHRSDESRAGDRRLSGAECEVQPDHGTHQKHLPPLRTRARSGRIVDEGGGACAAHRARQRRAVWTLYDCPQSDARIGTRIQRERRHRLVARTTSKWVSCRTTAP